MTRTNDQADNLETLAIKQIREMVIEPIGTLVIPDNPVEGLVIDPLADLAGLVIRTD